ncbi:MAG: MFS transporter, partial [Acidimicrobiaceae bacterium]
TAAGFGVAPGPTLVAVLAPRAGKLATVVGQRPLLVAGGLLFAASGLLRVVMLGAEPNYLFDYLPSMLLTALGVALLIPQRASTVAPARPPKRRAGG